MSPLQLCGSCKAIHIEKRNEKEIHDRLMMHVQFNYIKTNCLGLRLAKENFRKHRFCKTDLDLIDTILLTLLIFDCYYKFQAPFSNMFSDSY